MTDKRSEDQFSFEDRAMDNVKAGYRGFYAGYRPEDFKVSDLQEKANAGDGTSISGAALARGISARKKKSKEK